LVEASDVRSLDGFVFGTDGSGADMLLVAEGGARPIQNAIQPRKRRRWPSSLYMDGPELVKFSLDIAPPLIDGVLARAQWTRDQIDMYLIHQATLFMLDHLRERLSLDREHTPEALEDYGNTVSSTIPILIHDLRQSGRLRPGKQTLLIGFGVGLSWAGCVWTETWAAEQAQVQTAADAAKDDPVEPPDDPTPGPSNGTKARSDDASADSREAA
jgi:3-oxoacyl-[acyl-carrier-protein] synthase III